MTTTHTPASVVRFAASVKAGAGTAGFGERYAALAGRDAVNSHARASLATAALRVLSADDVAALFPSGIDPRTGQPTYVSANQIRNLAAQRRFWDATGFGDDYITRAWTLVTSSRNWFPRWSKADGKALMLALADAPDDATRYALLTGARLVDDAPPAPTAADIIRALTRVAALASDPAMVAPGTDDALIIAALLADIGATTGAAQHVAALASA